MIRRYDIQSIRSRIALAAAIFCLLLYFPQVCLAQHEHDHETEQQPAPAPDGHAEDEPAGLHEGHEDIVTLTPQEIEEFGLEVDVAEPGVLRMQISVPGEIVVNGDRLAHIFPRFPGIVKEVHKNIGDIVSAGEVLAVIESNESLTPFEVKSLIKGTVIDKHLTLGEVSSEEEPAFIIADLDTVWVNLSIYQEDLPLVAMHQKVKLSAGQGVPESNGEISYISPVVDKHTRTATARVVMPNHNGLCRPGLFVTGEIIVDEVSVPVLVPQSALQTMENKTIIFIREDEGFEPIPVTIGRSNGRYAEIVSGLVPEMEYVSKGGFILKAEMLKGGFDDGHHH